MQAMRLGLEQRHIPGLDGIRAISAFIVVFYHAGLHIPGALGVLIFFVLSGFLITWILIAEFEKTGAISLKQFYLRRALRIFPAFYGFWLLVTGLSIFHNRGIPAGQAVASFLYAGNYYQALVRDPDTALSHTWSLGVEEQFYLLWPLCFLMLVKDLDRLARWLAGAIVAVWIYRAILFGAGVSQSYFYFAFDTRADQLMAGCLLAVVLKLKSRWSMKSASALCFGPAAPALSVTVLVISSVLELRYGSDYRDTVGFLVEPLAAAALIAQVVAFEGHAPWKWLNWAPIRYLGRISYSIYLYQQIATSALRSRLTALPAGLQLAVVLGATILLAAASFHLIEQPFRRLRERGGIAASPRVSNPAQPAAS